MKRSVIRIFAVAACVVSMAHGAERWIYVSGGEWEPSADAIQPLQESLEKYVRAQAQTQHRTLSEWNSYRFQYQGQASDNRRYVFVSAFCYIDDGVNLHERIVLVLDGGGCFFTVKYDPSEQRFYDLVINGDA
jgi:hypothetical protein